MDTLNSSVGYSAGAIRNEAAPAPEVKDRMVVQNSWLSLLVKNVRDAQKSIISKAEKLGGYMVDSSVNSPEGIDNASVTVRVPSEKLSESLDYFRSLGVRVVSESLTGYDVTDQYVDIQAHLDTLNMTKVKFEEILGKAEKVQDILEVQREIINIQVQIDNLIGQQKYLEKNAQVAKVTLYLSTDELALPYAPAQPWRPSVIVKTAVRSLLETLRGVGTAIIWIVVFAVIWLPVLGIVLFLKKKLSKPRI